MFSLRLLAVFAVLAVASAYPATDKSKIPSPITTINDDEFSFPWMNISPFSLFAPLWKLIPSFADIGPRIYSDDDKFQVVVNAKDYRKNDLKVKCKGEFIFVQGTQEAKADDHDVFATQFFHTYTLPANSTCADVTAKVTSDGYLVVTAPVSDSVDRSKDADREVPIVETGAPYQREQKVDKVDKEEKVDKVDKEDKEETVDKVDKKDIEENVDKVDKEEKPENVDKVDKEEKPEKEDKEEKVEKTTVQSVEVPKTNPPTTTEVATTVIVTEADEEKNEPTTPSEPEDATDKDNVIPHGNEVPV